MLQAFVVTTTLLLGGLQNSPNAWSPDGRWLAYTVEVRAINQVIKPGWIFGEPGSRSPSVPSSTPRAYRLWATRADSGVSTLLEESSFPITGPCWSPEGRSLAFGRVVPEAAGKARFEVIILGHAGAESGHCQWPDRRFAREVGQAHESGDLLERGWSIPRHPPL